jgi:hypothetical protein
MCWRRGARSQGRPNPTRIPPSYQIMRSAEVQAAARILGQRLLAAADERPGQ